MASYLGNLMLMSVLAFFLVFWWKTQGVKQFAYQAAKRRCDEFGVQLLDQSVMLRGISFRRAPSGNLSLVRRFEFEFSTSGDKRYRGEVQMLGLAVHRIELETHRFP